MMSPTGVAALRTNSVRLLARQLFAIVYNELETAQHFIVRARRWAVIESGAWQRKKSAFAGICPVKSRDCAVEQRDIVCGCAALASLRGQLAGSAWMSIKPGRRRWTDCLLQPLDHARRTSTTTPDIADFGGRPGGQADPQRNGSARRIFERRALRAAAARPAVHEGASG